MSMLDGLRSAASGVKRIASTAAQAAVGTIRPAEAFATGDTRSQRASTSPVIDDTTRDTRINRASTGKETVATQALTVSKEVSRDFLNTFSVAPEAAQAKAKLIG